MEQKPTILILEDQQNWQNTISNLLDGDQYIILQADRLSTAITILRQQIIDVAIVDIRLVEGDFSNFDGITFLDELDKYYLDDRGHALMLSGIATKEHTIGTLTRPSKIVLNFFLKESLDIDKFVSEVQRAIRTTMSERNESSINRLSTGFLNSVRADDIAKILLKSKDIDNITASKNLHQILNNMLIRYSSLSEFVKIDIQQSETENNSIYLLCWSRKLAKAVGVVIREKFSNTDIKLAPRSPWSGHIALDTVSSSSTNYLDGIVFELPEITFEQFFSITQNG
jgi:response regulator RpfG family c-di-GMP phosphodiesterase